MTKGGGIEGVNYCDAMSSKIHLLFMNGGGEVLIHRMLQESPSSINRANEIRMRVVA